MKATMGGPLVIPQTENDEGIASVDTMHAVASSVSSSLTKLETDRDKSTETVEALRMFIDEMMDRICVEECLGSGVHHGVCREFRDRYAEISRAAGFEVRS